MKHSKMNVDTSAKGKAKRTVDGCVFDSELEARYFKEVVKAGWANGDIGDTQFHPKYILQEGFEKHGKKYRPVFYEADFEYKTKDGDIEIIDVKGMATEAAKIKRKWFDRKYKDRILQWISYSKTDGGWIAYDELIKARAGRKKGNKRGDVMK